MANWKKPAIKVPRVALFCNPERSEGITIVKIKSEEPENLY
jgi:hypothetical protein